MEKINHHEPVHEKIKIRKFTPLTSSGSKKLERKKILRDMIEAKFGKDLEKIQKRCIGNPLLLKVVFYIIESDKKGRSKSDLDNLLKPLCDVLSVNMVNGQDIVPGVGLIQNDSQIYEIRCKKIPLHEDSDKEGLDLQISIFT
jgi:Holliday junction resolvase RusA-like endonuclease